MKLEWIPGILILFLSLIVLAISFLGLQKGLDMEPWPKAQQRKILIRAFCVAAGWVLLLGILSFQGFFSHFNTFPPRIIFVLLAPLPFIIGIAFSRKFSSFITHIPPSWLILFQSFRILVEIILWLAYKRNLLPVQMSLEGRNFDLLTGIFAIPVAYYCFVRGLWPEWLAWVFNIAGMILLLNVLIVAVLSMPLPFRYFTNEPSLTIVTKFPFIYLPGVLVVLAYSLHIFSLRQLYLIRRLGKRD